MPNPSCGSQPTGDVQHVGQIVVVGANGSGKSRLGAWLENPVLLRRDAGPGGNPALLAYRIGAQRVLTLPREAQRMAPAQIAGQLARGRTGPSLPTRLQGDPVVGQTDDFQLLLNTLFAERVGLDREYSEKGRQTGGQPGPPAEGTLDRLQALWCRIFSERDLIVGDHVLHAKPKDGLAYSATDLSDGEESAST